MRRKLLIFGGLVAGIFFLLGFLASFQMPKIRAYILVKVEQVSRDQLPVRVLPGGLDLNFFPLGATLKDVKILPKDEIKDVLDSAYVESLKVSASPWLLIQGRFRLTDIALTGARIAAKVPPSQKKETTPGKPLEGIFDLLAQAPIHRLSLDDVSVSLELAEPRLDLELENISLVAEKRRGGILSLDLDSATIQAHDPQAKTELRIGLEGTAFLGRKSIELTAFNVRRGDSFVSVSGEFDGDIEALDISKAEGELSSELQIESLQSWAKKAFPSAAKVPDFRGRAFLNAKFKQQARNMPELEFDARTTGFGLRDMLFDKISAKGTYKQNEISIPKATMENSAGVVTLGGIAAKVGEATGFEAKLGTGGLQVHELLKTLGVGEIPVYLQASGEIPCSGAIAPKTQTPLKITCKGKLRGENLLVRDDMKSKGTIAALRGFTADGEVTIDHEKVSYSAELEMPESKGRSSGAIGYETGFKIDFEADKLSIKDIANLADLRLEGTAIVKGSTEGDSHAATVTLDLDGQDMWLEDFWLGQAKGVTSYKAGILSFTNFQGYYTVSRYNGDVKLDVLKKEITVNGRAPFIDARDILKVFSRKVKLPFALTGTGQATVKVSGPLEFTKLTYDLKSSLFRGSVAGETFDQAYFDVKANAGEVKAERVQLTKGASVITLNGVGHPDGTIQTAVQGKALKLEDSQFVSSAGLAVSGNVDFDMDLNGKVLAPDAVLRGTLGRAAIGDHGVADSKFTLKFMSKTVEGTGDFLGDAVHADFVMPLDPNAPYSLKVRTQEWNFAPIFAAISGPGSRKDYEGRLTSTIDLTAAQGGFWASSGSIKVDKFSLSRGSLSLRSSEPLSLTAKNGQFHVNKFDLSGENVFLKMTDSPHPAAKIDFQVNGKLDMTLLALLTPFFEELRGGLSFAFNLRAGPASTELLGSAYVEKGYLKFFEFPHPIEDIQIDMLFNQKKILFNAVKAEIGGGRAAATGGMELKGPKNYPVNVAGTFEKVTLNVPDKMRTTGSGTISFTGSWFPFTLKADYDVKEGMVTKEFGGDNEQGDGIRRDYFLPDALLQESFVPVLLDLQIGFEKGIDMKNEQMEGRILGALTVKGKPTKPSVLGAVRTDKDTKILYRDIQFEVTNANIQFVNPDEINPKLYVAARSRVQEYDINLLIQGWGSKPELSLTSVPPLQEKDIISLLALGTTDTKLATNVKGQEQAAASGLQVGSTVIKNNPISSAIKSNLGFDVQFSPGFDDSGNSSVQKIIVSRQFSQKLGVSASQSFGKTSETEAKVKYRLNDRVSLVGSWLGRNYEEATGDLRQQSDRNPNKLGVDVEYKFEFK